MERADKPTGEDHCGKDATGAHVPCRITSAARDLVAHLACSLILSIDGSRRLDLRLRESEQNVASRPVIHEECELRLG